MRSRSKGRLYCDRKYPSLSIAISRHPDCSSSSVLDSCRSTAGLIRPVMSTFKLKSTDVARACRAAPLEQVSVTTRCPGVRLLNTGENRIEPFDHGRVCENGVAQCRVRKSSEHCNLCNGHHFTGLRPDHRKAKNAIAIRFDQRFHESAASIYRPHPQHGHGQFEDPNGNTLPASVSVRPICANAASE